MLTQRLCHKTAHTVLVLSRHADRHGLPIREKRHWFHLRSKPTNSNYLDRPARHSRPRRKQDENSIRETSI